MENGFAFAVNNALCTETATVLPEPRVLARLRPAPRELAQGRVTDSGRDRQQRALSMGEKSDASCVIFCFLLMFLMFVFLVGALADTIFTVCRRGLGRWRQRVESVPGCRATCKLVLRLVDASSWCGVNMRIALSPSFVSETTTNHQQTNKPPTNQPTNQPTTKPTTEPPSHQSTNTPPTNQQKTNKPPTNHQPNHQPTPTTTNQKTNHPTKKTPNQPPNHQTTNQQTTNQQTTNQPTNKQPTTNHQPTTTQPTHPTNPPNQPPNQHQTNTKPTPNHQTTNQPTHHQHHQPTNHQPPPTNQPTTKPVKL